MIQFESVFEESYRRVLGGTTSRGNEFFDAFYDRFIAASPRVAEKFRNVDMQQQKTMLKQSLFHLANLFKTKQIPDNLHTIAHAHSKQGNNIAPALYHFWLESLLETVRQFDPKFTPDVELAWRMICSQGIAFMVFMYDRP